MLVWRLNLAWKSGNPNQYLRLGNDAKTDRTFRACFRQGASYGNPLNIHGNRLLPCGILLPSQLYRHVAPLKLIRCPRSLAPTLVTLPSMSLIPFAPLYLGCARSARPLPRGFTGHVTHPIRSIQATGTTVAGVSAADIESATPTCWRYTATSTINLDQKDPGVENSFDK
jgi:hypothetical protein